MSQARQLLQLQEIDTEIRDKKKRLGEVLQLQTETEELLAARKRVETAVSELTQWQTKRKDLNLELDGLNSRIKRSNDRLYSGKVTNPKELSDLQDEIECPEE